MSRAERFRTAAREQAGEGTKANPRYLPLSVPTLRQLLLNAKNAHTEFEQEHGPDEDWAQWYAEWMLGIDCPARKGEA